ncbi:MAG: SDR family oxidoreductase [Deltaproteobacteria bacterium]|nr:SDR family oxidoreductase [Deltaproteobacteria bacterium]
MTIVVTGAGGHVGGNLVRALLEEGRAVRAVVRQDTRAVDGLPVEILRADVLDPVSLRKAFEGAKTVFHLAARISITGAHGGLVERVNVEGPRNVAAACLDCKVARLVHFSSIHAFSAFPCDGIIDERRCQTPPSHGMVYDRTKAAGEREILAAVDKGLDAVIVNPTSIVGPHDYKPSRVGQVVLDLATRRLPALVDGGFNWVDVRDVVKGALFAEKRGKKGERYLLGGQWRSVADLAALVERTSGVKPPAFTSPMWLARVGAPFITAYSKLVGIEPLYTSDALYALRHHRHVSHAKARQELGYAPRPLEETIADTVAWFKAAGRIP